ncbi:hypothetical protein M9Y10_042546 [Tritrichomonas musculus]|uniref:Chorein N-terminal domain-containing protein n=2 Tax=Tritrichomonas musculus TaxID=1915356 RepID=A0ABR2K025_9EUKA
MLETIISNYVMRYLKEYLKPLDPGQLELDVLQGTIQIKNLQLLSTALTLHQIPFIIRKGCIKYVKVIFPWNNLKNAACDIQAEDLFLVLQFESNIILKSDIQADQKSIHLKSESFSLSHDDQVKIIHSIFESVIDNLHIKIKNIHLRIEFPCDSKPIIIGFSIPEITFQTVDENGKPVHSIQHPKFVRKELTIKDFSIYFDTSEDMMDIKDDEEFSCASESIQSFTETMTKMMSQSHQYLFKPTVFKSLLIHTKDKSQKITNQVKTTISEISLNLDLPQSRSIIHLNFLWHQFLKRRKYTNCMRPTSFNKIDETWQFAHRCAILKSRPHVFKPYLALTILVNRLKYVRLFKEAKESRLPANFLGSPKQKLVSHEKKIGPTPTIYLREYAEAIYIKEKSMKDQPNATAYEISQLKNIFESTEIFISMNNFSASFEIKSFNLNLLYEKEKPLISISFQNFAGEICSLENHINMNIHVKDASFASFVKEGEPKVFLHQLNNNSNKNDLVSLNLSIPKNDVVSSFECVVAPLKLSFDDETFYSLLNYFNAPKKKQISSKKVLIYEIGELLQFFKSFANYKMSVKVGLIVYEFPFICENNECKCLSFELDNFAIHKNSDHVIHKNNPEIPLHFSQSMNLKAKIDDFILFKSKKISSKIKLVFTNGKLSVDFNNVINFGKFKFFVQKKHLKTISYAFLSIFKLSTAQTNIVPQVPHPPVLIVGRSKINFDIILNAIHIYLIDEVKENKMTITIGDLKGSVECYPSSFKFQTILKNLEITQFNKTFVSIDHKVDFKLEKKLDSEQLDINTNISKLHIYLEFKSVYWLLGFMNYEQNLFSKIESNQAEPESTNNKSDQSFVIREERLKLGSEFIPPSMILSNSLLSQSIDEFLQGSTSYDSNSMFLDQNKDEEEELMDYSTDDDTNNESQEPAPNSILDHMKLHIKFSDLCMEMIDRGEQKLNSVFAMKALSVLIYNNQYKITIEKFTISRGPRNILDVQYLSFPLNLPEPIKMTIDYIEGHLFSGDIIALTNDSHTVFSLLFEGKNPLFEQEVAINAFVKNGGGSLRKENNEPMTLVKFSDTYIIISFNKRELNVDVKLDRCDGVYNDDNSHFLTLHKEIHCHYTGTPEYQRVFIDVPTAKLTFKDVFLPWFLVLEPFTKVDQSKLQPLEIKLSIQPGQLVMVTNNTKIQPIASKEKIDSFKSSIFNYIPNGEFNKYFIFEIGKTKCHAIRNKTLYMDFKTEDIHINTEKQNHPIFGIEQFHYEMNEKLVKVNVPSIFIDFQLPNLLKLLDITSYLISTYILPLNLSIDEIILPNTGIDIEINQCIVTITPLPKVFLRLDIPCIKLILNSYHNIAALNLEAIKIYSVNQIDKPILILNISKIQSILSFVKESKLDLSKLTFESIQKLPHEISNDNHPLNYLKILYKMDLVQINYSHFFVKVLIYLVFKALIDCKTIPTISNLTIDDIVSKIKIQFDCFVNKIQINLILIDPFASVTLKKIKLSYKSKFETSINDLIILPITKGEEESNLKSFMTKKNDNDDIISITKKNDKLISHLSEFNLVIDFEMLFTLVQYISASPFLKIKPLIMHIKKLRNPNEIIEKIESETSPKTIPIDSFLHLKKADIIIPVDQINEFQLHISAKLSLTSTDLAVNLSSLSFNLYDQINKSAFPPIVPNLIADFSVGINENSSLSFKANISDVNILFSERDIFYLILLKKSIDDTLNSRIYAFEKLNIDVFKLRISSIELLSSKMVIILCKDSKSSSEIVPIFRSTIPSINFKVHKSKKKSKHPVAVSIKPCVEYFNVVTGNFDLIIEPFELKMFLYIIDEQMKFGIDVPEDICINFPLNAIQTFQELIGEITHYLKNKETMKYEELPSYWLCNKLGSKVDFTIGKDQYSVEHDKFIPLFNVTNDILISFSVDNSDYTIETNSFNYPTYLSQNIVSVKKLYKGGMMISFERTFQVENNLSFAIDLYVHDDATNKTNFVSSINPNERQPLLFDKEVCISIIKKGEINNINFNSINLQLSEKTISTFQIECDNKKRIECIKTIYNDTTIAARIVSISSQYLIYNLMPSSLYFKSDDEEITSVKRGETTDFYYINGDTFSAYLSLDENKFLDKKSVSKISFKSINLIDICNSENDFDHKCMVEFSYKKKNEQTTIILYMPIVIFNTTLFSFVFEVSRSKNKAYVERKCNYKKSIKVLPKTKNYWCPKVLANNSNDDSLNVTIKINPNSKVASKPFDCLATGNCTIYLPSLTTENMFIPLRCNIYNQSRTSILTLSSLVTILNNLDLKFQLTPIKTIPTDFNENDLLDNAEGKINMGEKIGTPFEINSHSVVVLPLITSEGTVSISVDGFCTTPSLNLLEPQKTVFKIQNQTNYIIIELVVKDVETGISAAFNKVVLPTPIMINNQLDTSVYAFHLIHLTPFEILPNSTSIYAFDEPLIYPSVSFRLDDNNYHRISLVEDTERIEVKEKYKGKPFYVQVKHNKYGNRLIVISYEEEEQFERYKYIFKATIHGIAASLIDFQMRETALIYLSKFHTKLTFNSEHLAIITSLKSLQIDDQNPFAVNQTVVYGYFTEECPYLSFNCLCTMSTTSFISFEYFALNIQRMDVSVDRSFVSDWINLSSFMKQDFIHPIEPRTPVIINQKRLFSFRYFEFAPTFLVLSYNRKTSRPRMLGKNSRFLKFVPSIKSRKMILPGIILSRITDRIGSIRTKLIDDYKTAAFNAMLAMLGSGGKLLKILGITSAIASSLNIKMKSDMTTHVSHGKRKHLKKHPLESDQSSKTEANEDIFDISKFDNISEDEFSNCFSYEALSALTKLINDNSMNSSPLIHFIMHKFSEINEKEINIMNSNKTQKRIDKKLTKLQNKKDHFIQQAGFKFKIMPGIEYDRGVAGVLTKELNDPLENVVSMSTCKRIREIRTFAGAKISAFDPEIAMAQKIIIQKYGLNEKAKEISLSNDGEKKKFIIMTEKALYVFSDDSKDILTSVKFSDIDKVEIGDENIVKIYLKDGKTIDVKIDSVVSLNFLLSLLRMNLRFGESLLS